MNTSAQTHVVLVEDDAAQARLYHAVLRKGLERNVHCEVFSDPSAAAEYLAEHLVDILIVDLWMPGIDGLELIRRAKDRCRGVQVIVMTAGSTTDGLLTAADLGTVDYLLKPFDAKLLVALIHQAQQRVERWRTALSATLHRDHPCRVPAI